MAAVTTAVAPLSEVSGSVAADVTLTVFEKTVPGVPGVVTVMVNWTLAPLASDTAVQVTVPPDSTHPADADTNVTAPGSVSVTLTSLAVSGPLFLTVSAYVRLDDTVRSTRCGDLVIERSACAMTRPTHRWMSRCTARLSGSGRSAGT